MKLIFMKIRVDQGKENCEKPHFLWIDHEGLRTDSIEAIRS